MNDQSSMGHLCPAHRPDGNQSRCILAKGHAGMHRTFVAEWREGEGCSRRRQPPMVGSFRQSQGRYAAPHAAR